VNYSFSEVAVISRLELKSASIEINDNFEIGATNSAGYLSNELIAYDPSSNIRWIGTCTDSASTVTYVISGLQSDTRYDIWVDENKVTSIGADSGGSLEYTYLGTWSAHEFIIQKSDAPASEVKASFEYRILGDTIYFTDKSYNGPVVWLWNFGDGMGSTSQNPTHTYKASGTYTVSLTVYDANAKSSVAQTVIEIVLGPENPIDQNEGGWSIWISDDMTLRVSALGVTVVGAIMFLSGMYLNLPVITNKGRKIIGILLMLVGAYYFIFIDNGWIG
jgi:PKD repeat protein